MRISQQIFPRPVALIVTANKKNEANVMTASFLTPISFEPKYVAVAIGPKRYSFENLKEVPEFTMNLLSKEMKMEAEICGSYSGKNVDKFGKANLVSEN